MKMIIEAWNGVRWHPCDIADLPFSVWDGLLSNLLVNVAGDHWRAWPTIEAKRDWQLFISQTYMVPLSEIQQWDES